MIDLEKNDLICRLPEVHQDAVCEINFQRTLRIPDDNSEYPLPPGLGNFPLRHLDDFSEKLSRTWFQRGGVIMPMYQAEAMWIEFDQLRNDYPFAIKIATGKINAVTGERWVNGLNTDPQDYVVVPQQPWLDGYCVKKGTIRQFVAMPLGDGYTAEEQITDEAAHGGIQIMFYPMKAERYEKLKAERYSELALYDMATEAPPRDEGCYSMDVGLAPGGQMEQEIYSDEFGLDAWDLRHSSRCFVSIANAVTWRSITGEPLPTKPPSAKDYTNAGLPWFDYYSADQKSVAGSKVLGGLKSIATLGKGKGKNPLSENAPITIKKINVLQRKRKGSKVREAEI